MIQQCCHFSGCSFSCCVVLGYSEISLVILQYCASVIKVITANVYFMTYSYVVHINTSIHLWKHLPNHVILHYNDVLSHIWPFPPKLQLLRFGYCSCPYCALKKNVINCAAFVLTQIEKKNQLTYIYIHSSQELSEPLSDRQMLPKLIMRNYTQDTPLFIQIRFICIEVKHCHIFLIKKY